MKYYLIAGEASGDLHGSNLMKGLKKNDPKAEFRFFGGDKMAEQSPNLVKHFKEMAFMGIWEVLTNLKTINRNMDFCKQDILDYAPDVVIFIDFAGFNLRIAEFAKASNLKTFFYIAPKIWAWKESRIKKIKAFIDKLFVILPFEVDYYKDTHDYPVDFEGNPLTDSVAQFQDEQSTREQFLRENNLPDKPIVAILPGSRNQEIKRMLPIMLAVTKFFDDFQFIVAGTSSVETSYYEKFLKDSDISILYNKTYEIMSHSHSAVVTSGTATLETALFNVPQVVCYKTSPFNYHIGKLVVDIKYFSLVNLIMDKEVVKEFLQKNLTTLIKDELQLLLYNKDYRNEIFDNYSILHSKVGKAGASERVAKKMISYL